jgi:DNA-binding CsgD family transcriptional regulator
MTRDAAGMATPFIASVGVDPENLTRFRDSAAEMDPLIRGLAPGSALHRATLLPDAQAVRSDFYQDVIRPMGGFRAILSVLDRHARHGSLLAVCRPHHAADFSDHDVTVVEHVIPHIARALKARLDVEAAERRSAIALDALDRVDAALAVVDAELRPVLLSRRAEEIVMRGDGLRRSRNGLAALAPGETAQLRSQVRCAAAEDPRVPGTFALRLTRPPPRPPWAVTLRRLGPASGMRAGAPLVVVILEDAIRGVGDIGGTLHAMFDLTPREIAVATALTRGHDLAETADGLAITPGTVRNHLKAVFLKTHTHRQSELVSLILRITRFSG